MENNTQEQSKKIGRPETIKIDDSNSARPVLSRGRPRIQTDEERKQRKKEVLHAYYEKTKVYKKSTKVLTN